MMKKNMKKKSTARKLLPAAGMLAVSASMLATSTYAWFTMNKEVSVTGMQLKTKVGDNLLICTTNLDADYSSLTLSQARKGLLEPVSSINGATGTFYYTTDAKANGDAVSDAYTLYDETNIVYNATSAPLGYTVNADAKAGKNTYMNAFNTAYGNTVDTSADYGIAYGYVDYIFYIKATSSASGQKIVMSQCDLDYNANDALATTQTETNLGKAGGPDRAWRVAVFATNVTSTSAGKGIVLTEALGESYSTMATADNQKGLIALDGASNQTAGKAVNGNDSATGNVLNKAAENGVVIDTFNSANATAYYKVLVRVWLEGEDNTCTSETYAALTNEYSLDMKFNIVGSDDSSTAVKKISTNAFDANTATTQVGAQYDATPATP